MTETNPSQRHFATVQMELCEDILVYLEEESLTGSICADDIVNEALRKYFGVKTTKEEEREKDRIMLLEHNLRRGQSDLHQAIQYIRSALDKAGAKEKVQLSNGLLCLCQAAVHLAVADSIRE